MKLTVKTLKGSHFEIVVQPSDTIVAVKKTIEESQGKDNYPWAQQLLIHNGKVLKDDTTLDENKVTENGFLVVMLSKSKPAGATSTSSSQTPATASTPAPQPTTVAPQAPPPASSVPERQPTETSDPYGQAASHLVSGSNLEQTIQQLIDMGGGNWDRDTVVRALRAAYNNPERAVDYLYAGIPETAEVPVPVARAPSQASGQPRSGGAEAATGGAAPVSGIPNSSPLDLFPQGTTNLGAGSLDFLRDNPQFQQLRTMVQANPHILQPMLQELSKQNPQLLRLIQEHHTEFLQLLNEPVEGAEGDLFDQPEQEITITLSEEEQEAIGRLEAMGFDRALVLEAFLACDRNEQLAANYLLEHAGDED